MTLVISDEPPDRPAWMSETIRLFVDGMDAWRARLLDRVGRVGDEELTAGTDDDWGLGQIAIHLLLIERGVVVIALRLARGEAPGATGQPRPAASAVTRDGIHRLAKKAEEAVQGLAAAFPSAPNMTATARHPYYGDLNTFGWLLTLNNHYHAHLEALARHAKSSL